MAEAGESSKFGSGKHRLFGGAGPSCGGARDSMLREAFRGDSVTHGADDNKAGWSVSVRGWFSWPWLDHAVLQPFLLTSLARVVSSAGGFRLGHMALSVTGCVVTLRQRACGSRQTHSRVSRITHRWERQLIPRDGPLTPEASYLRYLT